MALMPRWNLTTMDLDAGIDDNRLLDVQFGEEMEYKQRIQEIQITNSSGFCLLIYIFIFNLPTLLYI